MKIKIGEWIECAVIGVLVMSNLSSYAMIGDKVFGRKSGFLRQVYGDIGLNVITAINDSKNIEPKVVSLFESTLNSEQVERDRLPVDFNKMSRQKIRDNQNNNLKALSKLFVRNFMMSDTETTKKLKEHCQKHFASSESLDIQKNIEKENFCQKYTLDDNVNSILILKEKDPYMKVLEYLLASEPMLRYNWIKSSVFIEITNPVFLQPETYEYFICITGTQGAKLTDGVLYVISDNDAKKSSFFSLWTLTCWIDGEIKNPGSIYFKISDDLRATNFSGYKPSVEQAELAAMLCLKKTFDVIQFEESDLYGALTYIANLGKFKEKEEYEQRYGEIQQFLKEKASLKQKGFELVVPSVFYNLQTENLRRDTQEMIEKQRQLGDWLLRFVRAYEEAIPLADAMMKWSNLGIDPIMLTWAHKKELQCLFKERKDLVEIMKGWARFMFIPQEKDFIRNKKDLGSLIAQAVGMAFKEKSTLCMKWLGKNIYLFSVLYQFANKVDVSKDYIVLLAAFRYRFPYGQWTYSEEGIDAVEMDEQMKFLLDEAKKRSDEFSKEDEEYVANCGFARIGNACVLFLIAPEKLKYIDKDTRRLVMQICAQTPKTQAELLSLQVMGILKKEKPDLVQKLLEKQKLEKRRMPELLLEVLEDNENLV